MSQQQRTQAQSSSIARRQPGDDPVVRHATLVDETTTKMVAAMPVTVPEEMLKRVRAQLRVAFSADSRGDLVECSPQSVARAIVLSCISGLMPGGPQPDVWLIPRGKEITWQVSFRGYQKLARRSGYEVEPVIVYKGDHFIYEEGMAPSIEHRPNLEVARSWENILCGYVRVVPLAGGRIRLLVITKDDIQKRRRKAQTDNVWKEWPVEMALKTLVNYAGGRGAWPMDDVAKIVMDHDMKAEVGEVSQLDAAARPRLNDARAMPPLLPQQSVHYEAPATNLPPQESVAVNSEGETKRQVASQVEPKEKQPDADNGPDDPAEYPPAPAPESGDGKVTTKQALLLRDWMAACYQLAGVQKDAAPAKVAGFLKRASLPEDLRNLNKSDQGALISAFSDGVLTEPPA